MSIIAMQIMKIDEVIIKSRWKIAIHTSMKTHKI